MAPGSFETKRKRLSTPRVKTGCITCRIRRVKCDEGKPSCQRCVKTGRKCDGYAPAATTTTSSPPSSSFALSVLGRNAPLPLSVASYSIPFRVPGSQRDRQLLHYFCVRAGNEMSGYLSSESNSFWSRTVLRGSHDEPVVRQALMALSSLHLGYYVDDTGSVPSPGSVTGNANNDEALKRYGKALSALQRRIGASVNEEAGKEQERTAMICCVLFYCFESALGESEGAMKHLENGLQVLASVREKRRQRCRVGGGVNGGTEVKDGEDDIADMLARLDLQATMFDDSRAPSLALVPAAEREAGIAELRIWGGSAGGGFVNVEVARVALGKLQNWLFRFLEENLAYKGRLRGDIPPFVLEEKVHLARDYTRWGAMFGALLERQGLTTSGGDRTAVKILGVHHRLTQLLLESSLPDNRALFGSESNPEAWALLDDIEEVIRSGDGEDGAAPARLRRSFSSETGVIAPLFLLAVKCADEGVVGRATGLLAACRRREGLYDAEVMTGVLGRLQAVRKEKVRALGRLSGDSISGEGGWEGLGEKGGGQTGVPLEFWAEEMVDSRTGGFDAIGGGLSV